MLTIKKLNKDRKTYTIISICNIDDFIINLNDYLIPKDHFIGITKELENEINRCIDNNLNFGYKDFFKNHIRRFIKTARTRNNMQYWLNRGYNLELANKKVSEFQCLLSSKLAVKKIKSPELYDDISPTQLGYWIKKGYSETESILKRSEYQRTFSLEKCIEKSGIYDGTKIWKERQKNWQKSLNKSRNVTWSTETNSASYSSYHKKYGEDWIRIRYAHLKKNGKTSRFMLELFDNINSIIYEEDSDIISFLNSLDFDKVRKYASSGIIKYLTGLSYFDIMSNYMISNKIEKISSKKYGNSYYKNSKYYKSDGEFEIGQYLENISVEFTTQKNYSGTKRFSDFYINKLDIYVELTGMEEIAYKEKKDELSQKKFHIIWSSEKEFIKKYIHEKIYGNKRG